MRRAVLLLLPTLSACANMAGLDGKSEFACRAPDGVVCTSVSGVYANTLAGTLPTRPASETDPKPPAAEPRPYGARPPVGTAPAAGTPLLSQPRVLRLWLAPWVDEDGDLHDQAYLYVMWHRGEWQLGHTEAGIRSQFAPIDANARVQALVHGLEGNVDEGELRVDCPCHAGQIVCGRRLEGLSAQDAVFHQLQCLLTALVGGICRRFQAGRQRWVGLCEL